MELFCGFVKLQPAGETLVEVGPCPLGDPGVGRIPDQGVPEAETVLAGNARPGGLDELPAHESEQRRPQGLVPAVQGGHGAGPELLAHDRCPLEHLALARLETVEPRGEEGLDRRRQRDELDGVASFVGKHRDELLGVERISLGNLRDAPPELRGEDATGVERVEKLRRFAVRERLKAHVHALPLRPLLEQFGTRDAEEEDRGVARPAAHVLDEVEQRRLGPVDILQDDDERPFARNELEEPPHCPEQLLRRSGSAAAEHVETLEYEGGVGVVAHRFRHALFATETLDELRQRPESDPVAVGETATRGDCRVRADLGDEFRHEARLPDPGRPNHRHQPALPALRARRQSVSEHAELAAPPHQRRVPPAGERIGADDGAAHAPCLDGSALALRFDRLQGLESRGVADEPLG